MIRRTAIVFVQVGFEIGIWIWMVCVCELRRCGKCKGEGCRRGLLDRGGLGMLGIDRSWELLVIAG